MRLFLLLCALSVSHLFASAQQSPLSADIIMARVAANQDKAQAERVRYVYIQHVHIASHKGKTVMCDETTDSRVTPSDSGSHLQLLKLDGRLRQKKSYITYTSLPPSKDIGPPVVDTSHDDLHIAVDDDDKMDRDIVETMRDDITNDKSKDGVSTKLFPLTSKEQATYQFHLLARTPMNGRDCFHITFSPKDEDEYTWKGDAYIDATAFQPVVVRTAMSRKIPLAVRTLLGTNVPGYGFTIVYAPQPDGVWFPTSFGTEFKLHVLFFFNREIIFSAENRDFEKTHVTSQILSAPSPNEGGTRQPR